MSAAVLLLNQNYEPLNVCQWRRALTLVVKGKAELLVQHPDAVRTVRSLYPRPLVIKLLYHVRRPRPEVKLSRREIFVRDNFTCQYCGTQVGMLTVDHVVPRHLGGRRRWENLVTACRRCNLFKGSRTPHSARMRLLSSPLRPRVPIYHVIRQMTRGHVHPSWVPFLPGILEPVG